MVKSRTEARQNYVEGLEKVGESAYRQAANADSISDAAEALESAAPSANVNFDQFAESWAGEY